MAAIKRLLLLNQMAGPLFYELALGLADELPAGCTLYTGEPTALERAEKNPKLRIDPAPIYRRGSLRQRLTSWLAYATRSLIKAWRTTPDTAILVVSNPPIMAPLIWLLCAFRKRPYVVLIYDIYPDLPVRMGVISERHPAVRVWRWVNRRVYQGAQAVVTIADHMAANLAQQFDAQNTPLGHVGVVYPWADGAKITPLPRTANPLAKTFGITNETVVLYSGNMGLSHDIGSMLAAAKLLSTRKDLLFLFIGGGDKWQEANDFKKQHHLNQVQVHPYVKEDKLPYSMALADISLVALDPGSEGMMIPSKLFYYMAAGAAVIGICGGENDLKAVIERAECGLCIGHGRPDLLATTIQTLADDRKKLRDYGVHARQAALAVYTPQIGVATFVAIMRRSDLVF